MKAPIHASRHPLAGMTVKIVGGPFDGRDYRVEDWWDRIAGQLWMDCNGNPACLEYAVRSSVEQTPINDEVVYGKIANSGYLMHVDRFQAEGGASA